MSLLVCCDYCRENRPKNGMRRITDNGIKYICNTKECEAIRKEKEKKEKNSIIEKAEKEKKQKQLEQEEKWGAYIQANRENFVLSEDQCRDGCVRYIDPYTNQGFKYSKFYNEWCECNIVITLADKRNIKKKQEELTMRTGVKFNNDDENKTYEEDGKVRWFLPYFSADFFEGGKRLHMRLHKNELDKEVYSDNIESYNTDNTDNIESYNTDNSKFENFTTKYTDALDLDLFKESKVVTTSVLSYQD